MHSIDLLIFLIYMIAMLGVGYFFMRKNTGQEDYYVGGRSIGSLHIGLSVVATDVGGGFSIGLGGLGFAMGLSGSWMLFTGLLGAWLAAVILIPRVKSDPAFAKFFTFPQIVGYLYNSTTARVAALICFLGYLGFFRFYLFVFSIAVFILLFFGKNGKTEKTAKKIPLYYQR